jgi:hypothetical protein
MIIYGIYITDPNKVGIFPPNVGTSEWGQNFGAYFASNGFNKGDGNQILVFSNQTALNTWLAEYTLTDAALNADIVTWRDTHSVAVNVWCYDIENSTTKTPTTSPVAADIVNANF